MSARLKSLIVIAFVSPLLAADHTKIGIVKAVDGPWCRDGRVLEKKLDVFLDDSVKYCPGKQPAPANPKITIEIHPRSDPQFDQTYDCSMAAICSPDYPPLWLEGAYCCHGGHLGHGTTTLSSLQIRLLTIPADAETIPDAVVAQTTTRFAMLSPEVLHATGGKPIEICTFDASRYVDPALSACLTDTPDSANPQFTAELGLHLTYLRRHDRTGSSPPNGLLLVVRPHSSALARWTAVPEAFRLSTDPVIITERRTFLMSLFETAQ